MSTVQVNNEAKREKGCSRGCFVIIYAPLWTENYGRRAYNGSIQWRQLKNYKDIWISDVVLVCSMKRI